MHSDEQKHGNIKPVPETKDSVAVALRQVQKSDRAPMVVASGRGTTAEQILEIAFALGIKVREDTDLAQILSAINDESEIPTEAFAAVAEILVYLYQVNGETPPGNQTEEDEETSQSLDSVHKLAELLAAKWREADEESK